ncbi:fimbrillin family protein [Sphingobacterium phlebotomi]|uniref:Fimbrillin family protein n=1 Tax=Sphingobacterium phlebotomi TaxID=2605433 RepID=A0A5D4HBS8_9SPHI|nr:fimbrillin family protein [Sphingobacterium phlebotomi]TYR36975.1 fimbrillin family protein [Sphingobacterium phlebotomi]
MKLIRFKRANWVVAMAMLALPGALVTSCSKETTPTEEVAPKGDKLRISVLGINNGGDGAVLKAKAGSSLAKANDEGSTASHTVYQFEDADMAVSLGNMLPVRGTNLPVRRMSNGLSANASLKMAEEIATGIKYVVYIYDGSTLVAAEELEAGTTGTIEGLDLSTSYTWVALSYSSESVAPELTPASSAISLPENTDVLYASGTVNLGEDPTIGILFDHVFSRIGIELNTIGVFGEITGTPAVSVSGLALATGSLDLLSGVLTPSGSTFDPVLTYADFENVDPSYDDAKIAYVYTAATDALNLELTVAAPGLTIEHADGGLTRTYFAGGATVNSSVTPEMGKSHHVLFNVVESALTTNYDSHEVKWGRSNLYYTFGDDPLRQYRFFAENELSNRANSYFAFGSAVPFRFPASSDDFADPCALVYPQGLWRQPTNADFAGLVSGQIELTELTDELGPLGEVVDATGLGGLLNLITSLLSNAVVSLINVEAPNSELGPNPYVYAQYNNLVGGPSTSAAFNDNSNHLRFFYNGQILDATVLQDIAEGEGLLGAELNELSVDLVGSQLLGLNIPLLETYETATALWTSEQGTDILGLAGLGSWGYFGSTGREFGILGGIVPIPTAGDRFVMGQRTGEAINNVSVVGVNALSTSMKNVRCVRAN